MEKHRFSGSFFRRLGYAVWLAMLAMALVFYKERAFFMDAGFQLFNLINEESIQVYHYRFVTAIPQILPFLFLKIGAPLWALAMSFSAAYILFYLLVYHLLVRHLKNDFLGWVLIFLFTLISFDTFYHIQSEFYLGLTLLLLVFGIVLRYPEMKEKWLFPLLLPLLITVGFSHKLALIFFLFLWLFFWLENQEMRHWRYFLFLASMLAVVAVKSVWFTNWYEAAKQAEFKGNLEAYFPNFHTIPANLVFLKRCLLYYYMLPVLLAIVSGFYLFKKQWLKLVLVWSFFLGYLLLYNISDPAAAHRFYSEVTYLPLTIFVAVPLLFDVTPLVTAKFIWRQPSPNKFGGYGTSLLPAAFAAIMLLRLTSIAWNSQTFSRMFSWIETKTAHPDTNRFLLKKGHAPMDTVLMEWGVPFTSMHLSALDNPKAAKTLLILPDFEWYQDKMNRDNLFFSPFHKVIPVEEMNRRYYDLGIGKYVEISR